MGEKKSKRRLTRSQKRKVMIHVAVIMFILTILVGVNIFILYKQGKLTPDVKRTAIPDITESMLTPNEYSRPQKPIEEIKSIVIHYVANPGSTALQNRNYFEGLGKSGLTYASSHYIVGLDGEIVQCIPLNEVAYASNHRNSDTISIETCHPDDTGKFNSRTYDELVRLTAWLCGEYNIHEDEIIRHFDITGKNCPKYFVENEKAWTQFKEDVFTYIKENPIE